MTDKGLLISFEGLDGSGKTTQIEALGSWLFDRGISYLATREPGGTQFGEKIRHLIMHPGEGLDPLAEALLFQADRAQHFAKKVLPALDEGKIVITDRCFDSNIVYQGFVKNVGIAYVEELSVVAMRGRIPDLTILLDISPQEVYKRRMVGLNRFDNESWRFHEDIRHGFLAQAKAHPKRIKTIDATKSTKDVHKEITSLLMKKFPLAMRDLEEKTVLNGREIDLG
jgi:dTMP kinase